MQYLGADGKGLMQLRLPLLISAVVIFAPYQSGGTIFVVAPNRSDLAPRVLAATLDDGAQRPAAQEFGHQLTSPRRATRLNTDAPLVSPIGALLGGALSVLWWLSIQQSRVLRRFRYAPRLSRGPPLSQLA
jgi:hypothetical protein